jgi:hypothetical protein
LAQAIFEPQLLPYKYSNIFKPSYPQTGDESSYSVTPWSPRGKSLSQDSEKAEALADTLETQFQPVTDPSVPAVIEIFDVALRSYFLTPSSEPKLTNPDEVHEAIRGLKVGKAPGPDLQCDSPHPSLPYRVEARSGDLYP